MAREPSRARTRLSCVRRRLAVSRFDGSQSFNFAIEADKSVNDVKRAAFRLIVDASDIQAHYASHHHVRAAEKCGDHDQRAPSWDQIGMQNPHCDDPAAVKK